jgi:hypothetical protein
MPNPSTTSSIYTVLILLILIPAFFPSLFTPLILSPLHALSCLFRTTPPLSQSSPSSVNHPDLKMSWTQKTLTLPPRSRGSYLITDHVVSGLPEIKNYKIGILHLFMQHTSAALSLNENWDEDVRADMSDALDRIVPEDKKGDLYMHSCEGSDDMPVSGSIDYGGGNRGVASFWLEWELICTGSC